MAATEIIGQLGSWDGYEVDSGGEERRGGERWCVIRLRPKFAHRRICSGCGEASAVIHDGEERRVRDLPLCDVPAELILPRLRGACPACGPKLERLSWLASYARVTTRLAAAVSRLCKVLSIRHVAAFFGLAWTAAKRIDH